MLSPLAISWSISPVVHDVAGIGVGVNVGVGVGVAVGVGVGVETAVLSIFIYPIFASPPVVASTTTVLIPETE